MHGAVSEPADWRALCAVVHAGPALQRRLAAIAEPDALIRCLADEAAHP